MLWRQPAQAPVPQFLCVKPAWLQAQFTRHPRHICFIQTVCIAYIAYRSHPDWPLLIAANRDEFHQRPTRAAAPWHDQPHIIAGQDLEAGGTWLGVSQSGRFALLTNYRDMAEIRKTTTRGRLVSDFLSGTTSAADYMQQIAAEGDHYTGFNLLVGDRSGLIYFGNRSKANPRELGAGRYVLSNHLLDTPWPKSERLRRRMARLPLDGLLQSTQAVFDILKDNNIAPDHKLPATGLAIERERLLSSPFIVSPDYGTRCSTVLAVHASGKAIFDEVSFNPAGTAVERHSWPFTLAI